MNRGLARVGHGLGRLAFVLLLAGLVPAASAQTRSRLAVIGDLDWVRVGQAGYCGEQMAIPPESRTKIFLQGGERTWVRIKGAPAFRFRCEGEYSFVPDPETAYIMRYTLVGRGCVFELFRVVPGGDPVPAALTREQGQICIGK